MKQLIWKLVIPLTVISFFIFTKWWYVLPIDAPDSMMAGFPFPYVIDGWHTSLSLQIFIVELVIDIVIYFLICFILVWGIDAYLTKIKVGRIIRILLLCISGICLTTLLLIACNPDNIFYLKRPFDIEILKTGYKFIWQGNQRPENFDSDLYNRIKNRN